MSITNWPIAERPREKLLKQGAQSLSDAELIAIFFRTGIRGKTALDLAREALSHFGNLRNLFAAKPEQFCKLAGIGPNKYVQLQATLEISKRHLQESLHHQDVFANTAQTRRFLKAHLRDRKNEVFVCLFLDSQHRLIQSEELFQGSINSANVHPRVVVQRALHFNAQAVIFAHNHPSGLATPSDADKHITQQLKKALQLIEVKVLDHIIIAEQDSLSLAEQGYL